MLDSSKSKSEYNVTEHYATPEDLMFLLTHTPIIPHFGEFASDLSVFEQLVQEHRDEKGIRTNSARFMITARKLSAGVPGHVKGK